MKKKVTVSALETAMLQAALRFKIGGNQKFPVQGMADFINYDNPKIVRTILNHMERKHLMKDEGWHNNDQWFSVTDEGCELCSDIALATEQKNALKIVEKTTHVGIPTTVKEKTISPAPRTYEDGSELNVGGEIGTSETKAGASYLQKDSKRLEFDKKDES